MSSSVTRTTARIREDRGLLVPKALPGSSHRYKYRLAFVVRGVCQLRYDNEAGKGDHRHSRGRESAYRFTSLDRLFADFEREARRLFDEDRDA